MPYLAKIILLPRNNKKWEPSVLKELVGFNERTNKLTKLTNKPNVSAYPFSSFSFGRDHFEKQKTNSFSFVSKVSKSKTLCSQKWMTYLWLCPDKVEGKAGRNMTLIGKNNPFSFFLLVLRDFAVSIGWKNDSLLFLPWGPRLLSLESPGDLWGVLLCH